MTYRFGMVNTGKRPLENGYAPLYFVPLPEGGHLFMASDLHTFIETGIEDTFRICLEEHKSRDDFVLNRLPMMRGAAEQAKRVIDEEGLRRFLHLMRHDEAVTPGSAPRVRERVRSPSPLPAEPTAILGEIKASLTSALEEIASLEADLATPPPRTRERTRQPHTVSTVTKNADGSITGRTAHVVPGGSGVSQQIPKTPSDLARWAGVIEKQGVKTRERTRDTVITGQTDVEAVEMDLVPTPPAPRVRTRTRG